MNKRNSVVAIYISHTEAESAVKELQKSGFDMKKLSIVGRDYHTDEHVVGYYNINDRMKVWGKTGAFWGGLWGLLLGSGFFWVPGLGPLLAAGPIVSLIVGALEGAVLVGGLSALEQAWSDSAFPRTASYDTKQPLNRQFVLIVHGTADEAVHAKKVLALTEPESLDHHQ